VPISSDVAHGVAARQALFAWCGPAGSWHAISASLWRLWSGRSSESPQHHVPAIPVSGWRSSTHAPAAGLESPWCSRPGPPHASADRTCALPPRPTGAAAGPAQAQASQPWAAGGAGESGALPPGHRSGPATARAAAKRRGECLKPPVACPAWPTPVARDPKVAPPNVGVSEKRSTCCWSASAVDMPPAWDDRGDVAVARECQRISRVRPRLPPRQGTLPAAPPDIWAAHGAACWPVPALCTASAGTPRTAPTGLAKSREEIARCRPRRHQCAATAHAGPPR